MSMTLKQGRRVLGLIMAGISGVCLAAIMGTLGASARGAVPINQEVRQAVSRSLPYLERDGVAWIEVRKCVSCHIVPFTLWTHNEAQARGFPVDAGKVRDWTKWSLQSCVDQRDMAGKPGGGGLDTVGQLLLARGSTRIAEDAPAYDTLIHIALSMQRPDGSWKAGGQLLDQKRPARETDEVSTMWMALALDSLGDDHEEAAAARDRAVAWLANVKPGQSNEHVAVRFLLERRLGQAKLAAVWRRELLSRQQEDGGWSWLQGEKSDSYATGLGIYTLVQGGVGRRHPAVRRAMRFLLDTQREDGAWDFPSTLRRKKNQSLPISAYWGTSWATLGLLQTLPPPRRSR